MAKSRIVESVNQIEKMIQDQLADHFVETLVAARPGIERDIQNLVIAAIKSQPEYISLLHGRLLGEFGLLEPEEKLDKVLATWAKDITTIISGSRGKINLMISMIQADFRNVLDLPAAYVKQLTEKNQLLPWLDWLLIKGDTTIIRNYEVKAHSGPPSRTGLAIMVEKKSGKWAVPSQYAGTQKNNWITRAVDDIPDDQLEHIFISEINYKW